MPRRRYLRDRVPIRKTLPERRPVAGSPPARRRRACSPAAPTSSSTGRGSRARPISSRARSRSPRSFRPRPIRRSKRRLVRAQEIRAFASRELGLPDNRSYTSYADLERPYAVWNVFATPELSLKPRQWCFPVAGCVAYRGYFAEADARAEAARLGRRRRRRASVRHPGVLDPGLFRRPGAVDVRPLPRGRARTAHLPRARAPGRLCEGRHVVQRVVRRRGGGGGDRALARRRGPYARCGGRRRACRRCRARARVPRRVSRVDRGDAGAPRRALRQQRERRREARGQGGRLRRDARGVRGAEGGVERQHRVRALVRGRREQRRHCVGGPVRRPGAAVRGAARRGERRPPAVLRAGEGPGGAAPGGARARAHRRACGSDASTSAAPRSRSARAPWRYPLVLPRKSRYNHRFPCLTPCRPGEAARRRGFPAPAPP